MATRIIYNDFGSHNVSQKEYDDVIQNQLWTDAIFDQWRECVADDPFPKWEF